MKNTPESIDLRNEIAVVENLGLRSPYTTLAVGDLITVSDRDDCENGRYHPQSARITKVKKSKTVKGCVIIDFEVVDS